MFQKLGLRYVLFTEKGLLRGLLTKKDVWYVLDGMEDDAWEGDDEEHGDAGTGGGVRRGGLREQQDGLGEGSEERGLLGTPMEEEEDGFIGAELDDEREALRRAG